MPNFNLSIAASYRIAFSLIIGFQAILLAYAPLYFASLGYTPFQVSLLSGMENIAGIIGPALLVTRAYPAGRGVTYLSLLSGGLMLFVSPIVGSSLLVTVWFLTLFFNRGVFVLINEGAQARDRLGELNYSESRSWGSASFLLAMYAIGLAIEKFGIAICMPIGVAFLFLLGFVGLNIKEHLKDENPKSVTEFFKIGFNKWHFIFYSVLTLIWASHGPAYTYMSLHLTNLGWSPSRIAISWNIAVITEILVFLAFNRIQRHSSLEHLLTMVLIACVVRWTIISITSEFWLITLSQILHGLTFGLCFVASQKLLAENTEEIFRKPAFAVYFAVTLGVGSLLGKILAGWATRDPNFIGDFHPIFMQGTYLASGALLIWLVRDLFLPKSPKLIGDHQ